MKYVALLGLFVLNFGVSNGQFLHVGIGGGVSSFAMEADLSKEIVFFFPNLANEIIILNDFETGKGMKLTGSAYAIFNSKNNYFVRSDLQTFTTTNKILYQNSVDKIEYIENSDTENTGYESMDYNYWFMGVNVDVGYMFMPTKLIRPYVCGGAGVLALMSLTPGETYQNERLARYELIENEVRSLRKVTTKLNIGAGFKYHALSVEAFMYYSIGQADISKNWALYSGYNMVGVTVRFDILTLNLSPKDTKEKVKRLNTLN